MIRLSPCMMLVFPLSSHSPMWPACVFTCEGIGVPSLCHHSLRSDCMRLPTALQLGQQALKLTKQAVCRSTHQGYAMALALQAVQNIAGRAPAAWLTAVDVSLVLTCAKEAPDSAVRNAALSLLEVLALKLPDTTLKHVLEVSQCHRGNHCLLLMFHTILVQDLDMPWIQRLPALYAH